MPGGKHINRRDVLRRGLAVSGGLIGLAASGYVGYRWRGEPAPTPLLPDGATPVATTTSPFVTRPDLNPPAVTMTKAANWSGPPAIDGSYFFLAPKRYAADGSAMSGVMVLDNDGGLVWFQPSPMSHYDSDLQVQTYRGEPVLTWWSGRGAGGHAEGVGYLADSSYKVIATVKAGNGLQVDSHEFELTPNGTAFITTFHKERTNLSSLGGPSNAVVLGCQAQEIDIATGKVVFSWDSLDHVGVDECYNPLLHATSKNPFDYFHMNSVSLADDGNILISARNTCAVYKVNRSTGEVMWRLNGKKSDFAMGEGAAFYWQHHSRAHGGGRLSLFDDGATPVKEQQSRGIILEVDESNMTCSLVRQYVQPTKLLAANQGSMQILPDGGVVVGWGDLPNFSEYLENGTMVMDARFPADDQSYRAFRYDWTGQPKRVPDVVAKPNTSAFTVYVSWNGDTRTDSWRVLAGPSPSQLVDNAVAKRSGFETAISVPSLGPYYSVVALDAKGNELAHSAIVRA